MEMRVKCEASSVVYAFFRVLVAVVFMLAGSAKAVNLADFIHYLKATAGFPQFGVAITAIFLPALELTIGVFLLLNMQIPLATMAAWLLSASFLFITGYSVIKEPAAACGCMPGVFPDDASRGTALVVRTLVFFVINSIVAYNFLRMRDPKTGIL
jgi:uncharacterized membrane protein YphA (DoxX/SURF4 family)